MSKLLHEKKYIKPTTINLIRYTIYYYDNYIYFIFLLKKRFLVFTTNRVYYTHKNIIDKCVK